jgi:hypothetical protein
MHRLMKVACDVDPCVGERPRSRLRFRSVALSAVGLFLFGAQAARAEIVVGFEPPGIQSSSAINTTTIDFDSASTGFHGSQSFSLPGALTANYVGTQFVLPADQYGGAGGVGNYLSVQAGTSVTLNLSAAQAYFGLWLSAADFANQVTFYNGNQLVGSFSAASLTLLPAAYSGNPNSQFLGDDPSEKFVFINFYAQTANDMFNQIVFTNLPGGTAFESDNHTFSTTLQAPTDVPEPCSLAIGGIGLLLLSGFRLFKKGCNDSAA